MTEEEKKEIGRRIKSKREEWLFSQEVVADKLGMKRSNVANYEAGRVIPPGNIIKELAEMFNTTADYLLGRDLEELRSEAGYITGHQIDGIVRETPLTPKEDQDIALDLERLINNLDNNEAMAFYGNELELDEEAKELLRMSLEQSMRLAKQMAKKKFTPKRKG